jgi:hypothetical protein
MSTTTRPFTISPPGPFALVAAAALAVCAVGCGPAEVGSVQAPPGVSAKEFKAGRGGFPTAPQAPGGFQTPPGQGAHGANTRSRTSKSR